MKYDFLVETYETERVKVVSVWSEFRDEDLAFRPNAEDARGRSVREQMVHQSVSEDLWFRTMLGIDVGVPPLPSQETRMGFMRRYAEDSAKRLAVLQAKDEPWFEGETMFFDVKRSRAWGHDAAHRAHGASSRAADGHAADAGARSAQQLWPHRGYGGPDAESRAHDLRVSEPGCTFAGRSHGRS
jgi:hypothetical protein